MMKTTEDLGSLSCMHRFHVYQEQQSTIMVNETKTKYVQIQEIAMYMKLFCTGKVLRLSANQIVETNILPQTKSNKYILAQLKCFLVSLLYLLLLLLTYYLKCYYGPTLATI